MQRSEVAADARFFGLGGRASGPRLRDGTYRLWNTDPGRAFGPGDDPLYITMPVQLVVADAATHLVFHDTSWDGTVTLREGEEGAGSGHDRAGASELRMDGGPLRCWVMVGTPARVLLAWASLTGAPALPPAWALGHHHARWGFGSEQEVRRIVAGYQERGLPLDAVHLDIDHYDEHQVFTVDQERFPKLPVLAEELRRDGIRLVSIVDPAVEGRAGQRRVRQRDGRGRVRAGRRRGGSVRGVVWPGRGGVSRTSRTRACGQWWGGLYEERLAQGFAGFWHDMNEPTSFAAFGESTLPRSARHALEGRGGDHREAHNVYALCMARAGYEGLRELAPQERPFVFSRSGWAGMQRYGGRWSGDVATGWPGLRASLSLVMGLGLCGVPYSGPDVGGFDGSPSPELYLRWFQLGAYLPLFRTHASLRAGRREPWEFGAEVLEHARVALVERRRLLPYFMTLAHLARRTGAPYVRPLWWGGAGGPRAARLRGRLPAGRLPAGGAGARSGRGPACGAAAAGALVRHGDGAGLRGAGPGARRCPACRGFRCSRARVPSCRCGATTAGWSWRCGRPPGGGPGAGWWCRTRATGGTSRRSSATSPAGRGGGWWSSGRGRTA